MVAREAVLNAVLHGNAQRIEVSVTYSSRELEISVIDDGCGFDMNQTENRNGHHFGLKGMQERAHRCGGKFRITTALGKGVKVEVRLPC